MSLSKLNHDCFFSVLDQLSTDRKLTFRQVNSAWCTLIEDHLRRRTSLTIFTKPIPHHSSNLSRLVDSTGTEIDSTYTVKQLQKSVFAITGDRLFVSTSSFSEPRFIPLLRRLYPAIGRLSIFHYSDEAHYFRARNTLTALSTWQSTLTSVALNYEPGYLVARSWTDLWCALFALPKLKYLHLENIQSSSAENSHLEAVFGRLEVLSAVWYIDSAFLGHLGVNLRRLSMEVELLLCLSQISIWPVCTSVQVLHLLATSVYCFYWKPNADEHLRQVRRVFPQLKQIIYDKEGDAEKKAYFVNLAARLGVEFLER